MKLAVFFTLLVLATCSSSGGSHRPSDLQLADNFQRHEADFKRLLGMSEKDFRVVRITYDFTWLDNNMSWPRPESELGFSRERWEEYRSLFKELDLTAGINRREDIPDTIFFIASSEGAALRGSEKGYAYTDKQPPSLVESLDRTDLKLKSMVPIYKKLKDNWYLYCEVGD